MNRAIHATYFDDCKVIAARCELRREFRHCRADTAKKSGKRLSVNAESVVVYRGIRIPPMPGKRSATSVAIRDAFRARTGHPRGESDRD
jgi:hypothetical protein